MRIKRVDPLFAITLLIVAFWGSLMLVFIFTKAVLLPIGDSDQNTVTSFVIHLAKSLVFLVIVGGLFYGWFKLTRSVRDAYLSNNS